ncbi:serine hydrolase [Rheinheimera fenheensis]|uniref:serine hydrolase n=1 Tax=Rheinheimera fenheensis TaxID=3152295 RepID=UPI00325DEDD6
MAKASSDYKVLNSVISQPERYRVQIIYTQIDRNEESQPLLTRFHFNVDPGRYYYPASTVKLPLALLALEWLNQQNIAGLTSQTAMLTDAAAAWQSARLRDETAANGLPSVAHYIKKVLLVSDNEGSNRLYELLGQDRINQNLSAKGLTHTIINHRLSQPLSTEQNRQVNPIRFMSADKLILQLPARTTITSYINLDQPTLGKAYMQDGELVNKPMMFTDKNRMSLTDFDAVIKRLVFPQLFSTAQRFDISEADRELVLRYMSMPPSHSSSPAYNVSDYPDNYAKFLLFGGTPQTIPDHIKVFNKSGWAYGHYIDGAYIVDFKHKVEFFLSAVIYANDNDILNDDNYQRDETAIPFLRQLGQFFYQYELTRPKTIAADLSEIQQLTTQQQ